MLRKFHIDLISVVLLVVLPGLGIWFEGSDWLGLRSAEAWSGWIVALCLAFVALFAWCSYDSSSRPAVAARRIRHWIGEHFPVSTQAGTTTQSAEDLSRAAQLRDLLRERHGWRWRYRDRWVIVVGDVPIIERLAPGLAIAGYAITDDAVLLYAKQTGAGDWVLSDAGTTTTAPSADETKAALRQRYFADYARAWQQFLNSLRWQADVSLSGTVDQLTLIADPQRSPVAALFRAIVYQAGAGAATQSLSDTLVSKAQQLVNRAEPDLSKVAGPTRDAPLAAAFGPLLRLAGSELAGNAAGQPAGGPSAPTSGISLPRYLERVTAVRLKLQQITMSADPAALSRHAAQAILQGKTSDLADSRDYASRVAASLGEQWSGFGDALFQRPLDQSWDVVLQPAAASLNDTWRTAIVADWSKSFGARYPFADSDNDASLPEMARFLRPDTGVIAQFVVTQLAGVIERQGDRWVLVQGAGRNALTVDPSLVAALNRLTRASTVLFPAGDARVRYELRAVPTPGVIDMKFKLSGRELHYFNQKAEWTPFVWPGEALENDTHVEWETEDSGLRSALDFEGRFGLIRLLEKAEVAQQDGARYLLKWAPGHSTGLPLQVQLRSEAGAGPLDALALRHFKLPTQIFIVRNAAKSGRASPAAASPPPLPIAVLEAAKHAETPLPFGKVSDYD